MIWTFGAKILLKFGLSRELAKRFGWVPPLIIAGLLVLLAMRIASNWFEQALDTAKEAGTIEAVSEGRKETLEQLMEANDAEVEIKNSGERNAVRYDDCLRNGRDKSRCERFKQE